MAVSVSSRLARMVVETVLEATSPDLTESLITSYVYALEAEETLFESVTSEEAHEALFRAYRAERADLTEDRVGELFCDDGVAFPRGEVPVALLRMIAAAMAHRDAAEEKALYAAGGAPRG